MKFVKTERTVVEVNLTREELFQKGLDEGVWDTEEEMEAFLKEDLCAQGILDTVFDLTGEPDAAEITDVEILDNKITW